VLIATEHLGPGGRPKLVARPSLPVGVPRPVDLVVTELGSFAPGGEGFEVVRLAAGVDLAAVAAVTEAPLWRPLGPGGTGSRPAGGGGDG
jgi:acyl CoA:acetate/3-ketoacid CoA transferase beta subunit